MATAENPLVQLMPAPRGEDSRGVTGRKCRSISSLGTRPFSAHQTPGRSSARIGSSTERCTATNTVGSDENYTFLYQTVTLSDPFTGTVSYPNTNELTTIQPSGQDSAPLKRNFLYDVSGQMTMAQLPYGGYLRWEYGVKQYSWTATPTQQSEVVKRAIAYDSGASTAYNLRNAVTEFFHTITYADPATGAVHPSTCLADGTTLAYRCWYFSQGSGADPAWMVGLAKETTRKNTSSDTTNLLHDKYTWAQDGAANPYIQKSLTITDEGTGNQLYSQTAQNLDGTYGNVRSQNTWNYSTALPGGTPDRTIAYKYKTDSDQTNYQNYIGQYLLNLLVSTTVTDSAGNWWVPVTNTYDDYSVKPLTGISTLYEHDSAYSTSFVTRGNVTKSVSPGRTVNTSYDITGTATGSDDGFAHGATMSTDSLTHSLPAAITPSTGQTALDASMTNSFTYDTSYLRVTQANGPNGMQGSMTYDTIGRPDTGTAPVGAQTTYSYLFGSNARGTIADGPYTTVSTTGTHWTETVVDGLGRPGLQMSGTGTPGLNNAVSIVATNYWPCACSPLGKTVQVSQPYKLGDTVGRTLYAFDGLGRMISSQAPDGSVTNYRYQGNWTTVTDPAGAWKQYQKDAYGNLIAVVEPLGTTAAPDSPSTTAAGTMATYYEYDLVNHLVKVRKPVTVSGTLVTQNRTFTYNTNNQLTAAAHPESGTTSYAYNPDGTLLTRTDAKNQVTSYTYDKYQRVTTVTHGSDATQTVSYTYDANAGDSSFVNLTGRLAIVTWGGTSGSCTKYKEEYGYSAAGQVTTKRLTVNKSGCSGVQMTATFGYDTEGKMTTLSYPAENVSSRNITATYAYDALSRVTGVSAGDMNPTPGCTVTQPLAGVAWASAAVYNPAGQMTGLKRFAGCSGASETYQNEAWTFNSMNQLTAIKKSDPAVNPGTATTAFMTYAYPAAGSNNGQVSSTTDSRLGYSISYTYDYLRRLTQANAGTHWNQTYTYDGFGNLTGKSVPAGSAEPVMPGVDAATNRIAGGGYDANGNATTVNAFTLAYDMENRMVSATSGSAVETYAYDPANHRVEKKIGSNTDYVYFWGLDGRLLATYRVTASGSSWQTSIVSYRIYLGKMLAGQTSPGYGNAVPMEDRLGTVTAGYPYGTGIQAGTGVESDVDFATYSKDSMTGFEYANQRYYSGGWGRFLSADRFGDNQDSANSQSWNAFAYANMDPVNGNDPVGLDTVSLPPLSPVDKTQCVSVFANVLGTLGFDVRQYLNSTIGILGIASFFENEASFAGGQVNSTATQVWTAIDWTFVNRFTLSADDAARFYGRSNIPDSFEDTITGATGSQVFDHGILKPGFNTQLINILSGSPTSGDCYGLAASLGVALGVIEQASGRILVPGSKLYANPVPGALQFASGTVIPGHIRSVTEKVVASIGLFKFYQPIYPEPRLPRPPRRH